MLETQPCIHMIMWLIVCPCEHSNELSCSVKGRISWPAEQLLAYEELCHGIGWLIN